MYVEEGEMEGKTLLNQRARGKGTKGRRRKP